MNRTIKIEYTMRAPLSHIGEVASNGSYFQTVLTASGRIPIVTGNSVRGTLRDIGAKGLLTAAGNIEAKEAKVSQEVFHVLFSGGNISGTMRNDLERANLVRAHFPLISVFGAGLGTMMLPGKLICGNLYPVCIETAEMLGIDEQVPSWHELIDNIEFTRTDDSKNDKLLPFFEPEQAEKKDKTASTQMRFSVQYMAIDTRFVQTIVLTDPTDIELGCFYAALTDWFHQPVLGGMSARGFGRFDAVVNSESIIESITSIDGEVNVANKIKALIEDYERFLREDRPLQWMHLLGGTK